MNGIALHLKKEMQKLETGSSKVFGSPDVWEGFDWPAIIDKENCYDLDFVAQINCAELTPFDKGDALPKQGVLYFFYDFLSSPNENGETDSGRVLYYDGKTNELEELIMVDDDGVDSAVSLPRPITFSTAGKTADKAKLQMCYEYADDEEYMVLLRLNSFTALDGRVKFNENGALLFLIKPDDLKNKAFSDVRVKTVYY